MRPSSEGGPGPSGECVLVTGGAGFVGSHLAAALAPRNEVRVLDDFSTGRRGNLPDGVDVIEGDVRDPDALAEAMAGVDTVFHEAALVSVPASVESPALSNETTAGGTVKVLDRARATGARVVLASSAAVYGPPDAVPVREDDPKTPESPYGIDKLAADEYARAFNDLYGLETVALRYFNVYGPRQSPAYSTVIPAFLDAARTGDPLQVEGDGGQTRDFVHVRDVVDANLRAATTSHVGEAFNVGTGESVSVGELADAVLAATGSDSPVEHVDARPGDVRHSRADISKARERLGYEPRVGLEEGLRTLVGVDRAADADPETA